MNKKERLQKLIERGQGFIGKNLTRDDSQFCAWNASVIRFIENEFGVNSTDTMRLKGRLYCPSVYTLGADNHSLFVKCFERDLSKTLGELEMIFDDIEENNFQEEKKNIGGTTINLNIDNSNTNTNTTNINISFEKLKEDIENDSSIVSDDKIEILSKLDEIKNIQLSNIPKKEKWITIKKILIFLLDKGVDFVIAYFPQILLLLKTGDINE